MLGLVAAPMQWCRERCADGGRRASRRGGGTDGVHVVEAVEEAEKAGEILGVHGDEEEPHRGGEAAHQPGAHQVVAQAEVVVEERGWAGSARRGPEMSGVCGLRIGIGGVDREAKVGVPSEQGELQLVKEFQVFVRVRLVDQ